ncbi:hypothetical protein [Bradyrhizobium sp. CCBAU 53415]|uniref:hypothetical protein n=1 Tax=Bradyrhizobium sp. CCBAU 53415 TaxID=1325119 RepID=UPI0023064E3C|nr:hypothetical protein [Bradyrhizobium sp. CCBAU 53415]MDA9463161.1 hypothetical protein [Bradyrhizobium sp. CCBAU 53415]
MTTHLASLTISDGEMEKRFAPVFEGIAAGAVERERNRALPFEAIKLLKEAVFGVLRVPVEFGGLGASLRPTFDLLTALAVADSNLPQALRAHFNLVEDLRPNKNIGHSRRSRRRRNSFSDLRARKEALRRADKNHRTS